MVAFLEFILLGSLISGITWAVVLFILSPVLMGDAAPESAKALANLFVRQHQRNIKLIKVAYVDGHLALASAILVAPPTIVLSNSQSSIIVLSERCVSGTMGDVSEVEVTL